MLIASSVTFALVFPFWHQNYLHDIPHVWNIAINIYIFFFLMSFWAHRKWFMWQHILYVKTTTNKKCYERELLLFVSCNKFKHIHTKEIKA